jgi:hypothetical protein
MKTFLLSLFMCFASISFGQEFSYGWRQLYNKNVDYQINQTIIVQDTVYSLGFIHYFGSLDSLIASSPVDVSPETSSSFIFPQYAVDHGVTFFITKSLTNGTFLDSKKLIETDYGNLDARPYITEQGDIILFGSARTTFSGGATLDFDSSPANICDSLEYNENLTFVAFYNSNGEYQNHITYRSSQPTSNSFGYSNFMEIRNISITNQNELFLYGNFHGALDADFTSSSDSIFFIVPVTGYSLNHQFLIKIDLTNYSYIWSKTFEGAGNSNAGSIKCNDNIVVLTGGFSDTSFDIDPSASTAIQNNPSGLPSAYISKLNINTGDFMGGFSLVGTPNSVSSSPPGSIVSIFGLALDDQSNIFLQGSTNANQYIPLDLDPTAGTEILAYYGAGNIFIAKYNISNQLLWSNYLYSGYGNILPPYNACINLQGSVISMGLNLGLYTLFGPMNAPDTLLFAPNSAAIFTGAYDTATGELIDHYELVSDHSNGDIKLFNIAIDRFKNIYLTLAYKKMVDFNQFDDIYQPDPSHMTGSGPYYDYSGVVLKLNWDGDLGMHELAATNELLVYPNPVLSSVTIKAESNILSYRIYAANGKLIKEVKNLDSQQVTEPLESISNGIYLIHVETQNGKATSRIVKQ